MALNVLVCKAAIKAEIENAFDYQVAAQLDKLCEAVAKGVVNHILTSAQVVGTGVCSTGGGPVTGTVT